MITTVIADREHSPSLACSAAEHKFFFEERTVGCFKDQLPSSSGQYRYFPIEGPGYLQFVEALASSGPQRCYYEIEGERRYFIVLNTRSDGTLLIHAHTRDQG